MLKISSYSLRGQMVRVKLKCTCGNYKIFGVEEDGKQLYFCSKCRSRKSFEELRKEASSYWRMRNWIIDCEADQRAQRRIHVNFATALTVKASRYSPAYCQLHGRCMVLSETGMLVVVEDFRQSYFPDVTSAYRFVEIASTDPVAGLPASLMGRIVGVRYRTEELPQCRIGVALEGLSTESTEALRNYILAHSPQTGSQWSEDLPPIDKSASAS